MISKSVFNQDLVAYYIGLLSSCMGLVFVSLVQLFNLIVLVEIVVKNIVYFVLSFVVVGITWFNFVAPLVINLSHWIFHLLVVVENFSVFTNHLNSLLLTLVYEYHLNKLVAQNQLFPNFLVKLEELR